MGVHLIAALTGLVQVSTWEPRVLRHNNMSFCSLPDRSLVTATFSAHHY